MNRGGRPKGPGRLLTVVGYAALLGAVGFLAGYVYSRWDDFRFISQLSPTWSGAAAICIFIGYLLNAHQLRLFLKEFGIEPGFIENITITLNMILGNLILPMRGGSGALAVYLKTVHKLDFAAFAAMYGGTAVLVIFVNSGLALIGIAALYLAHGYFNWILPAVVGGLFLTCAFVTFLSPEAHFRAEWIPRFVRDVWDSWRRLSRNRKLVFRLALSFVETAAAYTAAFHCLYMAVNAPLSLLGTALISTLGTITNLIPFTPGSIGFFEAVSIQVPQLFNMDLSHAVAAAALFRAVSFAVASIGLPGLWRLRRQSSES
jgi:uncharacterized membrane protein YbhN (UPF0104 family)